MSVERNLPLVRERRQALLDGDAASIAKQKAAGKLTARERIARLLDEASFVELETFAEASGVVTGYGMVEGNPVYVYAQDFTVKGGSVGAAHARKVLKVMDLAEKTGAPVVALCDSAGARLTEGADALNAYAQIMARTAALSGVVPQIALVLGPCAGGAAMCAQMNDLVITSKNGRQFVNGPQVVSAATGEQVTAEQLGGMEAQAASGAAHMSAGSDEEAILLARKVLSMLPQNNLEEPPLDPTIADDLNRDVVELASLDVVADMAEVIAPLADNHDLLTLQAGYAPEMFTALGRIGGSTVGFVATQPQADEGRLTVTGARKAARFIRMCDAFSIPVISFVDTQGMKLSCKCSQGDIARAGAQLMFAYADTTAPRIAVITGNAIGMGYAAMASRAAADMVYAWPGAVISPMGAPAAVQILSEDELKAAKDPIARRAELEQEYQDKVADGMNAALRGYVDDVIEPIATRQMLAAALSMLSSKRDVRPSKKHGNLPL